MLKFLEDKWNFLPNIARVELFHELRVNLVVYYLRNLPVVSTSVKLIITTSGSVNLLLF